VRLYFDTSVLGALTDRDDERRLTATGELLRAVRAGVHEGVISNVVQEELERAPVARRILDEIRDIEFELATESVDSARLVSEYLVAKVVPPRYRDDLRHIASPPLPEWMRSFRGTSGIS
jgi:predicted nucleic acid-binding protein